MGFWRVGVVDGARMRVGIGRDGERRKIWRPREGAGVEGSFSFLWVRWWRYTGVCARTGAVEEREDGSNER